MKICFPVVYSKTTGFGVCRKIDGEFINDLQNLNPSIDPCGENGEFHTLVTDAPMFKKKIIITGSGRVLQDGYWYLDISDFSLVDK